MVNQQVTEGDFQSNSEPLPMWKWSAPSISTAVLPEEVLDSERPMLEE